MKVTSVVTEKRISLFLDFRQTPVMTLCVFSESLLSVSNASSLFFGLFNNLFLKETIVSAVINKSFCCKFSERNSDFCLAKNSAISSSFNESEYVSSLSVVWMLNLKSRSDKSYFIMGDAYHRIILYCYYNYFKIYTSKLKNDFYYISQLCKIIMIVGILSIPLFTYLHLN